MNRNVESHFALNPTRLDMSRSKFDRSFSLKTSFNVGDIVPFYVDEVLPGDTFDVKTSKVVRMQTLITPIMDNIYLDTYYAAR
nr:MAG TPA: Major capsid protein [Microviridae sp.]